MRVILLTFTPHPTPLPQGRGDFEQMGLPSAQVCFYFGPVSRDETPVSFLYTSAVSPIHPLEVSMRSRFMAVTVISGMVLSLAVYSKVEAQSTPTVTADSTPVAGTPVVTPSATPKAKEAKSKTITTPSGLQYIILKHGTGAIAVAGNQVTVDYTGWLTDGTKFDSSVDRHQPFQFTLGAGQVIKGWDEGVAGMRVGEKRKLTIPSDLGYGAQGAGGVIPPNATLVFDVELLGVQ